MFGCPEPQGEVATDRDPAQALAILLGHQAVSLGRTIGLGLEVDLVSYAGSGSVVAQVSSAVAPFSLRPRAAAFAAIEPCEAETGS